MLSLMLIGVRVSTLLKNYRHLIHRRGQFLRLVRVFSLVPSPALLTDSR